jgi:hypothetical protein
MNFIATEPAPLSTDDDIENDGWFPDIRLAALREVTRLDGTVTDARLIAAVVDAMLTVNDALDEWKQDHIDLGHMCLDDIPSARINQQSQLHAHYLRAVYSTAKADLIEKYRDYDSTASSLADKKHMDWLDTAPEQERRNAHWAIANILKRPHMTVELI